MNTPRTRFFAAIVAGGFVAALQIGCVASRTYEAAQQKAYTQYEQDQRRILDLTVSNKQLKERLEQLESSLQSAREQLTRTEREWKEARDELLRLKIEKEQQPGRKRGQPGVDRPPSDILDENARLRDRLEDAKRRVKELSQQLQQMLEP